MAQAADWAALFVLVSAIVVCPFFLWRHGYQGAIEHLSPLWKPFVAVTLAQVICYHTAIDQSLAATQLLVWMGYMAVYCVVSSVPAQWVRRALSFLGWSVALLCLVEFATTPGVRAGLWFQNNPNQTAGIMAVLVPLLSPSVSWLVVGGAALYVTGSRGALIGVIVALVMATRRVSQAVTFVAIVALVLALALVRLGTLENRFYTWVEAWHFFLDRSAFGWGPGCYMIVAENEPLHPHADNWPLTIAAEMGLVGLAAWGWLVVEVAQLAMRSGDRARLGLVAFAVHNLVDCTLWWWWIGIVVMMCLALLDGDW